MHKIRPHVLSLSIITLVALLAFWGINNIFFQQDEWLGLGGAMSRRDNGGITRVVIDIFHPAGGLFRFLPLTSLANYVVFNTFGLNFSWYGYLAFFMAVANSLLIYLCIEKLTESKVVSIVTTLFWLTNGYSQQAITWISSIVPSQFSFMFFMLSFLNLLTFRKNHKIVNLLLCSLFMLVSLLFKESGIYYIFIFPLLIFSKDVRWGWSILIIPVLLTIVFPKLLFKNIKASSSVPEAAKITQSGNIIYNMFLVPSRTLFQVFIPQKQLYSLFYKANKIHYGDLTNGYVVESIIGDTVSVIGSITVLSVVLGAVALAKRSKKTILFSLVAFGFSCAPFVLFPNQPATLESRFYIFPALWAGLILALTVETYMSILPKIKLPLSVIILLPLLSYYVTNIKRDLALDIKTGSYRKTILETVSQIKPNLENNNIFYFFTDNNGFWEFQSGFGQTLAVWLYNTGKIPNETLTDPDFWDLSYEELKQYGTRKYGYFMTYSKLLETLKDNPDISSDNVHAYYWDYQKHSVKNVSGNIREKLKKDITNEEN